MSKRVIYAYISSDERRWIVDYLHDKHGWDPVFFHGEKKGMRKWVEAQYPGAILHDQVAMRRADFDYSGIGDPVPIDMDIIQALSKHELNYLNWLQIQDPSGANFTFSQRRRYYYEILKYWNTVIKRLKPEIFISYTWPHLPSDYPLYLLCKHFYHIPVLFLDPIPYLNDDRYSLGHSLENLSAPFEAEYLSDHVLDSSKTVMQYLGTLRSSQPKTPKHIAEYYQILDASYRRRFLESLRLVARIARGTAFRDSGAILKKDQKPWGPKNAEFSNFEYYFFKRNLILKNIALRKSYVRYAIEPRMAEKYVYFTAPYQPEVLSNHCAGVYEDIFLILDMLSYAIPKDWKIYYKEHPNTFKEDDVGGMMKDRYYYKKLVAYKNVTIVPYDMNTFTLIDHSQAVCTVGGTVGWEAVVRGKPAFVYGSLWYQACRSVFTIKTQEDLNAAVQQVINGFVPNAEDVERYAEAVYRGSEKGLVQQHDISRKDLAKFGNLKNEMERIAQMFYKAYETYYGTTESIEEKKR